MAKSNRTVGGKKPKLDKDNALGKVMRYDALRLEEKTAKSAKTTLATELKELAVKFGDEKDRSHELILGDWRVANRAAVKDVIDQEAALQLLESKKLVDDCTTRVLNLEAIEMCIQSGEITAEEVRDFMTEGVSYKIEVKKIKNKK